MTQHDPNLELVSNTAAINNATSSGTIEALLQAVEVRTERLAERHRRISARIQIPHSIEQVWQVLTDYETLADFIPNLARSHRLEHPTGGIRLEQVGTQRLLNFNFSARVILDLEEKFPQEINFQMVEGDFKDFSGSWCLEPCLVANQAGTALEYIVRVLPKRTMPISIIERRLSRDMQTNLIAIHQRVTELFTF
ncbi:SRPBCC family protein [Gloeocapsopsis crepidinum LEGE 06123]|uniref:SRPBCC family protein n=1 Tax=Gloeocapsopsis crepidinum LEGE 06123 TaxID=588587 RepID=A0ABR9UP18_9CHRO|nr:SRPBCC family protein [Gloeocapsopsis crepidinum]MBE9190036.1 SRPBCC family protein [Gloeocapsopsis crepidinum LEGE 06123]